MPPLLTSPCSCAGVCCAGGMPCESGCRTGSMLCNRYRVRILHPTPQVGYLNNHYHHHRQQDHDPYRQHRYPHQMLLYEPHHPLSSLPPLPPPQPTPALITLPLPSLPPPLLPPPSSLVVVGPDSTTRCCLHWDSTVRAMTTPTSMKTTPLRMLQMEKKKANTNTSLQ